MTFRMRVFVVGLLALLAAPRATHAGLAEFIWEMSGPTMLGAGYGCRYNFLWQREDCRAGALFESEPFEGQREPRRGPFLSIGGAYFFSTGKDSGTAEYDWFDVHMVALEPALSFRSVGRSASEDIRVYHSLGISYDFLFGGNFRRFDKFAVKITPVEFEYKNVGVGVHFRAFPNGFTDDEFGFGERQDFDRPSEWTWGIGFNYVFNRN